MVQAPALGVRLRSNDVGPSLSAGQQDGRLQVLILGDYLPYPNGMAIVSRARLVARALHDAGVAVRVLNLQPVDRLPRVENTVVRGVHLGIPFEYACGTTVRHESFVVRRLIAAWGWVNGALRLVQLRRQGLLDLVLLWFWTPRPALRLLFFVTLLRLLRVPVVREVNESPWSQREDATLVERLWSPLAGTAGAMTISESRALSDTYRKYGCIYQAGTQRLAHREEVGQHVQVGEEAELLGHHGHAARDGVGRVLRPDLGPAEAQRAGALPSVRALILVDMIADRQLRFLRESGSTRWLVDLIPYRRVRTPAVPGRR